jgi:hypothetical protein
MLTARYRCWSTIMNVRHHSPALRFAAQAPLRWVRIAMRALHAQLAPLMSPWPPARATLRSPRPARPQCS